MTATVSRLPVKAPEPAALYFDFTPEQIRDMEEIMAATAHLRAAPR